VNRNATHVVVAPHTTGEAFDITYRYMATDEQNFVMQQIATLESAARVEATRERRNCFHVFTFADGRRPEETAIASAREEVNPSASLESTAEPRVHPRRAHARTARAARTHAAAKPAAPTH
jgi:NCAIR mutase (PurE)-related protein